MLIIKSLCILNKRKFACRAAGASSYITVCKRSAAYGQGDTGTLKSPAWGDIIKQTIIKLLIMSYVKHLYHIVIRIKASIQCGFSKRNGIGVRCKRLEQIISPHTGIFSVPVSPCP